MNTSPLHDLPVFDDGLDDETVARVERNIDGAFDFLRSAIADPSMLDYVPKGAQIVLVYDDDPALSEANRRAAAEIEAAGGSVYVHRVKS